MLDDIRDWFSGPRVYMISTVFSAFIFSFGTFLSQSYTKKSTYFCFTPVDNHLTTLVLQWSSLVLDAIIIVLLWRMLAWTATTKLRVQLVGNVLLLSSLAVALIWVGNGILRGGSRKVDASFGSLYGFDVVVDSFAFAVLLISMAMWICQTSPITPISVMTFSVGIWSSCDKVSSYGNWLHISRASGLVPLWIVVTGTILFIYLHDLRSVIFIRRFLLVVVLAILLLTTTITAFIKKPIIYNTLHPINNLIYEARIEHDRWMTKAKLSASLSTAVTVYQERHGGRKPPPNFDEWFMSIEDSLVIDEFPQIDRDLEPFWEVAPETLRRRAEAMAASPGIARVTIRGGKVEWINTGDSSRNQELEELGKMIQNFSSHLPDMVLPVNLSPSPRILPSWEDANKKYRANFNSMVDLLSKRSPIDDAADLTERKSAKEHAVFLQPHSEKAGRATASDIVIPAWDTTWASDFRRMHIEACSPLSRSRARPVWNFAQFCWDCTRYHSKGQLMTRWHRSLEVCSQPDLKYLHGFYMTDPRSPPIRQLVPLFGASKTDEFKDIIIPLPKSQPDEPDIKWKFKRRYDSLVWRGTVGEHAINNQALRGSHKYRLLHLAATPDRRDQVTMILPSADDDQTFKYELVSAAEANAVVPSSVGVGNYSACMGANCRLLQQAYGSHEDATEPLEYRYVLLLDEDDGPPNQVLRTLRSNSVPLLSTIFKTWYTDRIVPWLHFVPIDVRYQTLHTTFAYFSGTENRPKVNGRETSLPNREKDAEWIMQQGQKWAATALRNKDMEIYLFRLLLEWGRLIDNGRNEIGFWMDKNGDFQNNAWTR